MVKLTIMAINAPCGLDRIKLIKNQSSIIGSMCSKFVLMQLIVKESVDKMIAEAMVYILLDIVFLRMLIKLRQNRIQK